MPRIVTALSVFAFLLAASCLQAASPGLPRDIEIVTEELPPYHYTEGGKVTGVSTEIVQAVLGRLGIAGHFTVLPWPRAVRAAENEPNVLIYLIVRNPAREHRFKWLGDIAQGRNFLYCLADRDLTLTSLEDARKYVTGTVYRDFREDYLLQHGFVQGSNLDSAVSNGLNYAKLKSGRIDLWISDRVVMNYLVRAAGDDPKRTVKVAYEIDDPAINTTAEMAFGLKTDDHVADAFRKALETIKADGTYAAIVKKWAIDP